MAAFAPTQLKFEVHQNHTKNQLHRLKTDQKMQTRRFKQKHKAETDRRVFSSDHIQNTLPSASAILQLQLGLGLTANNMTASSIVL